MKPIVVKFEMPPKVSFVFIEPDPIPPHRLYQPTPRRPLQIDFRPHLCTTPYSR